MSETADWLTRIFPGDVGVSSKANWIPLNFHSVSVAQAGIQSVTSNTAAIGKGMMALGLTYLAYVSFFSSYSSVDSDLHFPRFDTDALVSNASWGNAHASFIQASHLVLIGAAVYSVIAIQSGSTFLVSAAASASMIVGVSDLVQPVYSQMGEAFFFEKLLGEGAGSEVGYKVQLTQDGGSLVVGSSTDLLLAKFTANGTLSWAKSLGSHGFVTVGHAIQLTSDGGSIVCGSTTAIGAGATDLLLLKFTANGAVTWAKTLGGADYDMGYDLQVTPDGDYIVTGMTRSFGGADYDLLLTKFMANGTLTWAKALGLGASSGVDRGYGIQVTTDGASIVTGMTNSFGGGYDNLLLAKFTVNGTLSWGKSVNGAVSDVAYGIQLTPDGGSIITGWTDSFAAGPADLLLAKFTANGTLSWFKTLGGAGVDEARGIQITLEGGYIVTGKTNSFNASSNHDLLLAKFTANGTLSWAKTLGGAGIEEGWDIQITPDGGALVTGYDLLMAKFDIEGNIPNCTELQTITPSVQTIIPSTSNIPPSAVRNIFPIVQDWSISTVDITRIMQAQCFYTPPTTGSTVTTGTTASTGIASQSTSVATTNNVAQTTNQLTTDNSVIDAMSSTETAMNVGLLIALLLAGGTVACSLGAAALFYYKRSSSEQRADTSIDFGDTSDSLDGSHLATPRVDSEHYQNAQLVDRRTRGRAGVMSLDATGDAVGTASGDYGAASALPDAGRTGAGPALFAADDASSPGYGVMPEPATDSGVSDTSTSSSSSSTEDAVYGDALPALSAAGAAAAAPVVKPQAALQEIAHTELAYGDVLGEGGFGTVYQGVWHDSTVAIKQLKQQSLTEDSVAELHSEATIMSQLRNPHVLQFYGFCFDAPHFALVMEYMPEGSMYGLLHSDQALGWDARTTMGIDVGAGLSYLHQQNILHRDLKSMNVLLYQQGGEYRCKLTDFGLSKIKTETKTITADSGKGTLAWMAPELFGRRAVYAKASDIYSYAVVLWELATRATPFSDAHNPALIAKWVGDGEREDILSDVPVPIRDVITQAWAQDPASRLSATQIVKRLKASQADSAAASVPQETQPTKSDMADNFASQRPKAGAQGQVAHNLASAAAQPESDKPLRTGPGLFQGNNADKGGSTNPFVSSLSFGSSSSD